MSGERPDVLDRLDAAAIAVASLNALLVADGSLDDVLHGVALNAVRAVPGADAVSITLVDPPLRTVAHTDDDVVLDQEQYARRQGPCLEAAETRRPVRAAMGPGERRWPEFVSAARAAGVRATLSIPLIIAPAVPGGDDELVGSLNAYSRSTAAFDVFDEKREAHASLHRCRRPSRNGRVTLATAARNGESTGGSAGVACGHRPGQRGIAHAARRHCRRGFRPAGRAISAGERQDPRHRTPHPRGTPAAQLQRVTRERTQRMRITRENSSRA